ncbi:S1C family serine protease [Streptomyces zagrosensis]|uniref:Putative serine protease PepD n=1 Tax=Streptomyces zagrosensis TaxID=1042984 RepID=A0A7W9UXF9_9ACTN|nr:trypsin-like peptidase domain-containing protein [Streptomyces zagrosensis]MBB5934261.1 putative serine protease PepD [Streptomyces zagrosensis]
MSTEHEGAAVPPETEPRTAPPASNTAPGAEAPTPDYGLAPPKEAPAPAAPVDAVRTAPAEPVYAAGAPAAPGPADGGAADGGAGAGAPGSGGWWAAGGGQPHGEGGGPTGGGSASGGPGGPGSPWGVAPLPGPHPSRRKRGGIVAAVLAAVLVAGGIGGGIGFWAADREDDGGSTTVSAVTGDSKANSRAPGSVSAIADKTLPSVVTIEAQSTSGEGGTGTGFVYDQQGHILTNNHVVASAADSGELRVTFSNGKKYRAEVVGRAEGYDIAVLKLKDAPGKLTPLPLADSEKVEVGDATVAIGAPFGLSGTVTTGIVSAKKRPVASSDGGGSSASYMSALQTDASINPGNSGGPLLNDSGAVIGVNSAIQPASSGGGGGFGGQGQQSGSIGLGFAIPINQAKQVAEQLMKTGKPVYPVIEATVNMKDTGAGATISRKGEGSADPITEGGPADKAGLRPGDVITKLDDTVVDSGPTLISEIWTHQPGDKVTITFTRGGKESTTQVTLGQREGDS